MAFDTPPLGNSAAVGGPGSSDQPALPADSPVALGDQFVISTHDAVPALNGLGRTAWRATDRRHPSESYAALICNGEFLPRLDVIRALRGVSKPGMLSIAAFGPVDWPGGQQRLAVVCAAPQGGKFALKAPFQPWQITDTFLRPVAAALAEVHNRSVTHRAISADNLFLRDGGGHMLSLGPCVMTPPAFELPSIYEPLNTAAADPAGRGEGSPRDDMFALGMTVLALFIGRTPGADLDRDELMIRRIEQGSLAAVIDHRELPRELIDVLDGLTADDEEDRWTLLDLQKWLNAGRPKPPPVRPALLAPKTFTLAGRQVRTARALAYVMGRNWREAAAALRTQELSRWVRDYAPERIASPMLEQSLIERDPEGESAGDGEALMTARAVTALDPNGPVRYRELALDPHGLGPLLYDSGRDPNRRATLIGLLRHGLIQRVLDRRPSERRPSNARRATRQAIDSERVRRWIASSQPWEGYERCLYELNAGLQCQSPLVGGAWISTIQELTPALDRAAQSGQLAEPVFDAALAAFLASRYDTDNDALLCLLKPDEADDVAILSAIRLFAELQQSAGMTPMHGLTMLAAKLGRRIALRIHHRPTRKHLTDMIDQAAPTGFAATVLRAVDIAGLHQRDDQGYAAARATWAQVEFELRGIANAVEQRRARARRRGRENIAFASSAASLFALLATFFFAPGK